MDKETQNITSLHEAELRRLRERIDRTYTQLYDTLRVGGSGGGAPTDAPYIVAALDARLDNERALAEGWGIALTDGGAGGNMTIAADQTDLNTEYWRLNRIVRMGATWTTYEKSAAGLIEALAAYVSGDAFWLPPGTYATAITIPDGARVVGVDRNSSIIGGEVTFAGNGWLSNCAVVINVNSANDYAGIIAPDVVDKTGYINQLFVLVNNAGAGHGYGILVWGREGNVEGDYCPYIYGSTQDVLF